MAMNNLESDLKQDMMVEEMEDLVEDQVWEGLGFCLKFLQVLRMSNSAVITLEKLGRWLEDRR